MGGASGYVIGIAVVLAALIVSRVAQMAYEHDRIIRRVDAFLTVWARYGRWPPECEAALKALLDETDLPQQEEPPSSMGMDFGLGLIVLELKRRWHAVGSGRV